MILVSHSLRNLSFYHGPLPPPLEPFILVPISVYLPPLVQFCFFPSPICGFPSPCLFSLPLPALSLLRQPSCLCWSVFISPLLSSPQKASVFDHFLSFDKTQPFGVINIILSFSAGHVDAGKSTLMGHLLYLLGNVNKRTMHKYEQESKKAGKASFAYAWVLDETGEERDR